ncbi:periplasmic heavy metal sensor [Pseudaestuariivita sp.]|uniref:periplasmic heavy metal sensor n=1 Tax=Pseudaestuariivita sp. TaxID=2211669 RepID=UPI0040583A7A
MSDKSRAPRWMRVVLALSLAFNLVVVGLVAGVLLQGRHGPRSADGAMRMPYIAALPPEARKALAQEARVQRRDRADGADRRVAFAESLALLRADPFDAGAFAEHIEAHLERSRPSHQAGRAALVAYLSGLPAEARAAYADRLEAHLDKRLKP